MKIGDVAQILHRNRNLTLYCRGQSNDYQAEGKTIILPSIYRKKPDESRLMLKDRFRVLEDKVTGLKRVFKEQTLPLAGTSMLNKYPEIAWMVEILEI